jgi:hypothetical protein
VGRGNLDAVGFDVREKFRPNPGRFESAVNFSIVIGKFLFEGEDSCILTSGSPSGVAVYRYVSLSIAKTLVIIRDWSASHDNFPPCAYRWLTPYIACSLRP